MGKREGWVSVDGRRSVRVGRGGTIEASSTTRYGVGGMGARERRRRKENKKKGMKKKKRGVVGTGLMRVW